ncbi:MAG: Pectate disaccharide-lyase [Firmicutes bacterium]|nr:Pectate disaccharide-lyase [Bacillota bacterium]
MSDLYVSNSGSASNAGTVSSPLTLAAAITRVVAGGTIYMMSGTYSYAAQITIERGNNGTSGSYKSIKPYNSGTVILDFSSQTYGDPSSVSNPRGLQINGNYWHIKGLAVKGAADNGIYIGGSYNKIELCETYANRDSGLQLGRYISTAVESEWPAYNEILNCTSHDNSDPDNGEDADGFACKLTTGEGNVFSGCISYNNVDDGWDLYTKSATGAIGVVTIEDCVAYNNGVTSSGTSTANSDGNGFKLGGDKVAVNHIVKNCIAFNNKKHGFTYNSNPGSITLTNCTSYNNGTTSGSNFSFDKGTHVFTNLLSYKASSSDKTSGTDVNSSNVWWKNSKTTNAKGLACSDADFVSLIPAVTRNKDGSINLGSFLKLAAGSDLIGAGTPNGTNIGAR